MIASFARTGLAPVGLVLAALALSACNPSTLEKIAADPNKKLSSAVMTAMKTKGMTPGSPIMARIFKEEGKLEIWKAKANGRYDLLQSYDICKWSGKLGPKFMEGDRQAPEGFYSVRPAQMNPNSSYHLSFNIGYPNAFDRAHGRGGSNLMVHGACSSSGCYSMTDAQVEEIYALGREAFKGGQTDFQVQAYPFRMTAANMARYKDDPNYPFWQNLKEGYDQFEVSKVPPKVDVCEKRYVFNRAAEPGKAFSPAGACPAAAEPEALQTALQSYRTTYEAAFSMALEKGSDLAPRASIAGPHEAKLVAEWTKKRARGERIPVEPPSMEKDGTVTVTARMGRIDSPLGRRMAAADAEAEAERKAAEEKKRAAERAKAEKEAAKVAARQAEEEAAAAPAPASPPVAVAEPAEPQPGVLGKMRKRLGGLFGS